MNSRGTTLVSVLVAFLMLLVCCGVFYKALTLAVNMTDKAAQLRQRNENAENSYYEQRVTDDAAGVMRAAGAAGAFELRTELGETTDDSGVRIYYFK